MQISLIVGTLGREKELRRLFSTLALQVLNDFEVVLVDQNSDDRLNGLVSEFAGKISIKHLHALPGLSRARNLGLRHAEGDLVAFPDDDAWYAPEHLEKVAECFGGDPELDGLTCIAVGSDGVPGSGKWDPHAGWIDKKNVWGRGNSATIVVRRSCFGAVGGFDEDLGVGSGTPWGSGEEADWLLRCLNAGKHLFYDPGFHVFHEEPVVSFDVCAKRRALSYGRGMGAVLRKNRCPIGSLVRALVRPLVATIFFLVTMRWHRAGYYWNSFLGRSMGYLCWR